MSYFLPRLVVNRVRPGFPAARPAVGSEAFGAWRVPPGKRAEDAIPVSLASIEHCTYNDFRLVNDALWRPMRIRAHILRRQDRRPTRGRDIGVESI
jgi:hypothetical protein